MAVTLNSLLVRERSVQLVVILDIVERKVGTPRPWVRAEVVLPCTGKRWVLGEGKRTKQHTFSTSEETRVPGPP